MRTDVYQRFVHKCVNVYVLRHNERSLLDALRTVRILSRVILLETRNKAAKRIDTRSFDVVPIVAGEKVLLDEGTDANCNDYLLLKLKPTSPTRNLAALLLKNRLDKTMISG